MDKAAKFPARKPADNENNLSLATPATGSHTGLLTAAPSLFSDVYHAWDVPTVKGKAANAASYFIVFHYNIR